MDLGVAGRTAVVCASTSGLGEAVARALGAEGANVVVSGRRGERAGQIADELPSAVGVEVDLTAEGGPDRLLAAAADAFGEVDILVLNGPGPRPGGAAGLTADDIAGAVHSLVLVQQRLVEAVLPGMRERGWGRILAVGSSGVVSPIPKLALSNTGRAALAGYLKTLSAEVAADGVTVLDATTAERERRPVEQVSADAQAGIPARRYGRPDEFGAVAAFLCGAPASYVTGTALRCDGGLVNVL